MIWGYPHFRKLPNSISSDCILAVFKLIIKCWRHFWDGSAPSFSITELFRTQEFLTFDQCLLLLSWPSCCAHRLTEGKKSSRKKAAKGSRMSFNWPARLLQSCAFLFLGFFLLEKCWVLLFRALVHPEWHLHRVWYSFWGCRLIWHLCWLVVVSHNFAYVHCFFWRMPLAWLMPHLTRGFVGLKHVETAHQSKPLPCRLLFTVVLLEKLKNDKSS